MLTPTTGKEGVNSMKMDISDTTNNLLDYSDSYADGIRIAIDLISS